jgi:hypothetical protein
LMGAAFATMGLTALLAVRSARAAV